MTTILASAPDPPPPPGTTIILYHFQHMPLNSENQPLPIIYMKCHLADPTFATKTKRDIDEIQTSLDGVEIPTAQHSTKRDEIME